METSLMEANGPLEDLDNHDIHSSRDAEYDDPISLAPVSIAQSVIEMSKTHHEQVHTKTANGRISGGDSR